MKSNNGEFDKKFRIQQKCLIFFCFGIASVFLYILLSPQPMINRAYIKYSSALDPLGKEFYNLSLDEHKILQRFSKFQDKNGRPFIIKIISIKNKPNIKRLIIYSKGLNGMDDYDYDIYYNDPFKNIDDYGVFCDFEKDELSNKYIQTNKGFLYPKIKNK